MQRADNPRDGESLAKADTARRQFLKQSVMFTLASGSAIAGLPVPGAETDTPSADQVEEPAG